MNLKDRIEDMGKGPSKIEWVFLIIVLVFCFLSFNHFDIAQTSLHGKDLLICTMHGDFFKFYDITKSTAVYLIPIYIIFAIWSIPAEIICHIFNWPLAGSEDFINISFKMLMWYKILPTIFTLLTAKLLVKISREMGLSGIKQRWVPYVFLSFPPLIFSQFVFGQYDSICMFITTLSLYFYLKRKYYKFSFCMSLAITLKFFPMFIFIPLILLAHKKLIDIFKHLFIGLLGVIICNLLFINSPGFILTKKFNNKMIDRLFASGIKMYSGKLSFFLVIFIFICVYAYGKKIKDTQKTEYYCYSIYIALITYSALFVFVLWHPQWIIILVPFLVLSLFISDNEKIVLILYFVLSIGYLLVVFRCFPGNVDERLINQGIFAHVFNKVIPRKGIFNSVLCSIFKKNASNICILLFSSPLIVNSVISFPKNNYMESVESVMARDTFDCERGYLIMQLLPIFIYILPTMFLYFVYYK